MTVRLWLVDLSVLGCKCCVFCFFFVAIKYVVRGHAIKRLLHMCCKNNTWVAWLASPRTLFYFMRPNGKIKQATNLTDNHCTASKTQSNRSFVFSCWFNSYCHQKAAICLHSKSLTLINVLIVSCLLVFCVIKLTPTYQNESILITNRLDLTEQLLIAKRLLQAWGVGPISCIISHNRFLINWFNNEPHSVALFF